MKTYPPTYAGMIEQARDVGTAEEYHYAATVIRKSRNLTRLGRANALRDLRDATGRSGREMPSRDVFLAFFRTCKLSDLRRRQRINAGQIVRACRIAQLNDDRRPRMLEALGHLHKIEDYLTEAIMVKEFPDVTVR